MSARDQLFGRAPIQNNPKRVNSPKVESNQQSNSLQQKESTFTPQKKESIFTVQQKESTFTPQQESTTQQNDYQAQQDVAPNKRATNSNSKVEINVAKKTEEASKYRVEANRHLKTSWTKWGADHDAAAPLFQKSGEAFQIAGEFENAKFMFISAAESFIHSKVYSMSAANYQKAANMAAQLNQIYEAKELYEKATEYYLNHGSYDRAVETLMNAAKAIEPIEIELALELYFRVLDIVAPKDSTLEDLEVSTVNLDHIRKILSFTLSIYRFSEALAVINKFKLVLQKLNQTYSLQKLYLTETIVQLAKGDLVLANNTYANEHLQDTSYLRSQEAKIAEDMILAVKQFNDEALSTAVNSKIVFFLDSQVCQLAKKLTIFGICGENKRAEQPRTTPKVQNTVVADDEDENKDTNHEVDHFHEDDDVQDNDDNDDIDLT